MRYILSRLLCNDFEWAPYGLQKSLPALPFLPPHYFPPITTGWDTLEKSSCYHRFFLHCTCKLEEGTYSQYCIAKGKKSRTGPAIQHTQAPARSRTLFHCVCARAWVSCECGWRICVPAAFYNSALHYNPIRWIHFIASFFFAVMQYRAMFFQTWEKQHPRYLINTFTKCFIENVMIFIVNIQTDAVLHQQFHYLLLSKSITHCMLKSMLYLFTCFLWAVMSATKSFANCNVLNHQSFFFAEGLILKL